MQMGPPHVSRFRVCKLLCCPCLMWQEIRGTESLSRWLPRISSEALSKHGVMSVG